MLKSYKRKILFIISMGLVTFLQAQCIVQYQYYTKLNKIPVTRDATLYISDKKSYFMHSRGENKNIIFTIEGKQWNGESYEEDLDGYYQDTIGAMIVKDFKANKLYLREFFDKTAYVSQEATIPVQAWRVENEFKTIGKFKCQKATTKFRGRLYTGWFTTEIPINEGPWKFHGLPGLILEVYDSTGEVKFLFSSIDYPAVNFPILQFVPQGKKVPFEIYKKADEIEFEENKRKFMSLPEARGAQINITYNRNVIEMVYE